MLQWILAVIIIFIILATCFTKLLKWYKWRKLLLKVPGPKGYPIIGNLFDVIVSEEKLFRYMRRWGKEHYPIYSLYSFQVHAINMMSPEDLEIILSSKKHMTKSCIYRNLQGWLGTGLLTSTGDKWHARRKILTPGFHFNILQDFVKIFTEEAERLVKSIDDMRQTSDIIKVEPLITNFTLQTVNETAMGYRLNHKERTVQEYKQAIYQIEKIYQQRLTRPWLYPQIVFSCTPMYYKERKLVNTLHTFTKSVIAQRRESTSKINDDNSNLFERKRYAMLDLLLKAQQSGMEIDEDGIREEVDTFMFEGHDTTAAAICFSLMLLANYQEIQEKVVDEIHEILGKSKERPSYNDLQQLVYMERCIKEVLRMYPSVYLISRETSEEIKTHSGYIIPEDTTVHIHIYDLHHNPKIYPDPEKFDPDRFLPENIQNRHNFAYLPFSAGPRNCIGQKFAIFEMKAVLCAILRRFKLEPIDRPEDIELIPELILRPKNGLRVKFIRRIK